MKRVNLIPAELLSPPPLLKDQCIKAVSVLSAVFILVILWQGGIILYYKVQIAVQKKEVQTLQSGQKGIMTAYDDVVTKREEVNNQRKQIVQKLALLQGSRKKRIIWSNVLTQLSVLVPEDIKLSKISLEKDLLVVGGLSSQSAYVSEFMSNLDESKYFDRTGFNYIGKTKDNKSRAIEFEITTRSILSKFQ